MIMAHIPGPPVHFGGNPFLPDYRKPRCCLPGYCQRETAPSLDTARFPLGDTVGYSDAPRFSQPAYRSHACAGGGVCNALGSCARVGAVNHDGRSRYVSTLRGQADSVPLVAFPEQSHPELGADADVYANFRSVSSHGEISGADRRGDVYRRVLVPLHAAACALRLAIPSIFVSRLQSVRFRFSGGGARL